MEILTEQPTEEKPVLVENYPYGFRLRTQIRYYVETTKRGQRFVSQTLNPKTKLWNKPKKSVYSQIILVGKEAETGYIKYVCKSASYSSLKEIEKFGSKYGEYFSEYQKKEHKIMIGLMKVYDKVEHKIVSQRFKHRVTGEIKTQIDIFQLGEYDKIDEKGNIINEEKEEQDRKEINRNINKTAVISAKNEGVSIDEAIAGFKRA